VTNTLAISEDITTLRQVEEKLGLTLSIDRQFFTEWLAELPELSEVEIGRLNQVRQNYLYQVSDLFATRSHYRNNLHEVLKILKYLGRLIVNPINQ
jgi:hypothetical protein